MKNILIILSICLLMVSGFSFASESGAVKLAPFHGVGKESPVVNSKFFVMEALVKNGVALVALPLDTPAGSIALVLGEPAVKAFTKDQRALEPLSFQDEEMKRVNMPAANTRFNLDMLSPGVQALTISGIKNPGVVQMVISQPESPLEMQVQVKPLAARCGETVTVSAQLRDEQLPQDAVVTAAVAEGPSFKLNDNGVDGDRIANDGIYGGTFTAPQVNGFQGINIRFTANGKRFNGADFQRNTINAVMVTQPRGKILNNRIAVNPNEIIVPLMAAQGKFRVEIIFGFDGTALAYSRENISQQGNPAEVRLPIPAEALCANRAVIRLLNKDTLGLEEEFEIQLTPTRTPPDFSSLEEQAPQMPESKRQAAEKMKEEEHTDSHIHH